MKIDQKLWEQKTGWRSIVTNIPDNNKAQLVFVFGGTRLLKSGKHLKKIKSFYPKAHLIGCSTAGEIVGTKVYDNSLVITAVYFEKTRLQLAKTEVVDMGSSFKAGEDLALDLKKKGLRHVFVLSDGLNVNGSELIKGLKAKLPNTVAVTGGLAGDQERFKQTLVFADSSPKEKVIAVIGFYGKNLMIGYGSMGGWDSFGPDRLVTRSKGNILYELDGKPALALYKKYLGKQEKGLPSTGLLFPLSLGLKDKGEGLVRTIVSINEKEDSMTFAGDIPQGSYVRLMKANFERLIDGAQDAASMSYESLTSASPDLAILISCIGRKLVLKQRIEEETESVQNVLGKQAVLTGFYSYGEICPTTPSSKQCEFHNQTMTITAFSEKVRG